MSAARARSHLYALLGALIADGPRPDVVHRARALPALAEAVAGDPDLLAAAHHHSLMFELSPHESVFRGEDGLLGGAIAAALRAAYARTGFAMGRTDLEPDHLGLELSFLAHLAGLEAEARDATGRARAQRAQAAFLDTHLLTWLPAAAVVTTGPFATIVTLATELAASHRDTFEAPRSAPALPDLALDLEAPDTGLRHIARWLLQPGRSGWVATNAAVSRIAMRAGVPAGFGARAERMASALFAAADRDLLPTLLETIAEEIATQSDALERLGEQLTLAVEVAPWISRQAATRAVLRRLRSDATREARPGPKG